MTDDCAPVVVGIDGSQAALTAARWAVPEAINRATSLRLVYADNGSGGGPSSSGRGRRALDAAYSVVTAVSPRVQVQTASIAGRADCVLIDESKNASMVCIGTRRQYRTPLGTVAIALSQRADCDVAIIREGMEEGPKVIAVVLDDSPGNDAVVHLAMTEGRLRHATVRQIDRRINSWVRRFPDVPVQTVASGCGHTGAHPAQSALAQLAVVGHADSEHIGELVTPNCHPIVGYPDCSVLLVRN